jgi:transcriptional regulator with XRE-family HTH domain
LGSPFGRTVRRLRDRCGLSQEKLAQLTGMSRRWLAAIEGGVEPRLPDAVRLAEELARRVPGITAADVLTGYTGTAIWPHKTADHTNPRQLMQYLGPVTGTTLFASDSVIPPAPLDDGADLNTVLTGSEAMLRRIAHDHLSSEPQRLLEQAWHLRAAIFALIDERREGSVHTRRDSYLLAGYLSALMGWILGDLGYLREAEANGAVAWLCAEMSGDPTLRAWVIAMQSKTAFWAGRYADAVRLARRSFETSVRGTAKVMLACREASAWAQLGASEEASAALYRAEVTQESVRSNDEVAGIFSCDRSRQGNYSAVVLVRLGQHDDAIVAAERALAGLATGATNHYGTEAQIRISLAAARLMTGEAAAARTALQPLFAIPSNHRLDTLVRRVWRLQGLCSLPRHVRNAEAQHINNEVRQFCAGSEYHLLADASTPVPRVVA